MNSNNSKIAPLASQESLDKLPSKFVFEEPWAEEGFNELPQSDQNLQIFQEKHHIIQT